MVDDVYKLFLYFYRSFPASGMMMARMGIGKRKMANTGKIETNKAGKN